MLDGENREATSLLEGVQVVDLTRFVSGPYCTMVLADLGADVVKLEEAEGGDGTRRWAPDRPGTRGPDNPYFMSINRGKRSVRLDLSAKEGQALLYDLVRKSDVVVHNFRQDSARRLGVAYDDIRSAREDIVYCEISGYGHIGPKADVRALDFIIQAETGMMQLLGDPGSPPYKVPFPLVDLFTANIAAIGIVSALLRRTRTGEGARLSTSLFEAGLAAMTNLTSEYLVGNIVPEKVGSRHQDLAPYEVHQSMDGFLAVGVANEIQWKRFCALLGIEKVANAPEFATSPVRVLHRAALDGIIDPILASRTTTEWVSLLTEAGIPCAPVRTVPEALADEQAVALGVVQEAAHPFHGAMRYVRTPLSIDGVAVISRRMPPQLGADTEEILRERTSIEPEQLAELYRRGIVRNET